jgi:hypothetical protein
LPEPDNFALSPFASTWRSTAKYGAVLVTNIEQGWPRQRRKTRRRSDPANW